MPRVTVGFQNLSDIDGGQIAAEFNDLMKKAVRDCIDRPGLSKARRVTLNVTIEPDDINAASSGRGVGDTVQIGFEVTSKIPAMKGKFFQTQIYGNGDIVVNPASPDDVHQRTLDEELGDGRKAG